MSKYYVWRRHPDGHLGVSCGSKPQGWTQPNDGVVNTFEILGEFNTWDETSAFVRTLVLTEDKFVTLV